MSKKKLLALLIPAVSFLSGVFAQVLLDQWISSRNILLLSIALVIISLITIFIILKYLETRFDGFDSKLMRIANRMGIHVEYVEDGETGKSYLRSADLVEQAQTNLIFVAQWEPFPNYLVEDVDVNKKDGSSRISEARRRITTSTYTLHPGEFILGMTKEKVFIPNGYQGFIETKGNIARAGIQVHNGDGHIDPGFSGHITLEISNMHHDNISIQIASGIYICQLFISRLDSDCETPYNGKYLGQTEPTAYRP